MKSKKLCKARKQDGSKCEASALAGSEFCFFHDPSRSADRRAAQSTRRARESDENVE